jgi:RNA recognition motif-containing protein
VSFENERHDSALVRYELHLENTEDFLGEVRQATNNTKLGGKTMIVEPFRPDSLLFVGNLTPSIDDSSLQSMFDAHGRIERAFVSLCT